MLPKAELSQLRQYVAPPGSPLWKSPSVHAHCSLYAVALFSDLRLSYLAVQHFGGTNANQEGFKLRQT